MYEKEKKQKSKLAFSDLRTCSELKENLLNKAKMLHNTNRGKNTKYLCHYTNLTAAISIINSKLWILNSPVNMNDGLELLHANKAIWQKIFFASFMLEPRESIAMWSMYAQPWAEGVILKIPVESIKKMLNGTHQIFVMQREEKKIIKDITEHAKISFHAVAYTNADSKEQKENEELICGNETNNMLYGTLNSKELIGFVKNSAWSYENEYRLRVDINASKKYDAVAIGLSDDFVNSVEIVSGPRFAGDLFTEIQNKINVEMKKEHIHKSIFDDKLKWVYCDSCKRPAS